MSKRVFLEEIVTLALVYNYEASSSVSRMLPKSVVQEYDRVIDANLDEMQSTIDIVYPLNYAKLIYTNTQDEKGNWYYVIKYDVDMENKSYNILASIKEDLKIASQMPNALEVLGIQMENGKMKRVESQNKTEQTINLNNIIERFEEDPQEFYKKIANALLPHEREFIISQIQNKGCFNCTNGTCCVETYEKTSGAGANCIAWDNKKIIGQQLGQQLLLKKN